MFPDDCHATQMTPSASVSVVIPAYNAARWLDATLQSVLAQTGVDLDIIVVDDGSTDGTRGVVEKYQTVRYLPKTNGGQASARNLGIRSARGEFIAFVDADDLWLPGKLNAQIKLMRERDWAWCYCDGVAFNGTLNNVLYAFSDVQDMLGGDVLESLLLGNFIPSPAPVVKRCVFDQVGLFNEDLQFKNREDWEMWLRIAGQHELGYLPEVLFAYRLHAHNNTRTENQDTALNSKFRVIDEAVARQPARLTPMAKQARTNQAIGCVKAALRAGQRLTARRITADLITLGQGRGLVYLLWMLSHLRAGGLLTMLDLRAEIRARLSQRRCNYIIQTAKR